MKKLGIVLGILVAVVAVLGVIAPTDFVVEKEVVINKPKDFVFSQLKMVKNHNQWSPWAKKDPNMTSEYKGEDGTVGFVASWAGNSEVGVGEQEIKNIVEGQRMDVELRFKQPMEATSAAYFLTEAVGENQTKVTWGMKGNNKFPWSVVCFVMNMKKALGREFESGLSSLKTLLEGQ